MRKGDDGHKVAARRFEKATTIIYTFGSSMRKGDDTRLRHIGFNRCIQLRSCDTSASNGAHTYTLLDHRCEKVMVVTTLPQIGLKM